MMLICKLLFLRHVSFSPILARAVLLVPEPLFIKKYMMSLSRDVLKQLERLKLEILSKSQPTKALKLAKSNMTLL